MKNINTAIYILTSIGSFALLAWYIYAPNRKDNYIGIGPAIHKLKCRDNCTKLAGSGETDLTSCVALCDNNFDISINSKCSACS